MKKAIQFPKRNNPSKPLLKNYIDKNSGKVGEARKEIKHRFNYLDWSVQKRFLIAFLNSGKTDRAWAYTKLLKFWDKGFAPVIEGLWNQYHEYKCSWLIIRYFPEQYVLDHIDSLTTGDNYYHICKRLGNNPNFVIDKSHLSVLNYLSVLYSTERRMEEDEPLNILFKLISDCCSTGLQMIDIGCPYPIIRHKGFNPMDLRDVSRAVFYINSMGHRESADVFIKWCNDIEEIIKESPEYKRLQSLPISDEKYIAYLSDIAVIYMYLHLPLSMMPRIIE